MRTKFDAATEDKPKAKTAKPVNLKQLEGQDKMSLAELEEELESATEPRLTMSLLNSIVKKAYGPRKLEFMQRLVQLYHENRLQVEFLELAPKVLKLDSTNIDLRF